MIRPPQKELSEPLIEEFKLVRLRKYETVYRYSSDFISFGNIGPSRFEPLPEEKLIHAFIEKKQLIDAFIEKKQVVVKKNEFERLEVSILSAIPGIFPVIRTSIEKTKTFQLSRLPTDKELPIETLEVYPVIIEKYEFERRDMSKAEFRLKDQNHFFFFCIL